MVLLLLTKKTLGMTKAALRYAKALYQNLKTQTKRQAVLEQFQSLYKVHQESSDFAFFLKCPLFKRADSLKIIKALLNQFPCEQDLGNLLKLLAQKRKLNLLFDIGKAFEDLNNRDEGIVAACLTTAYELDNNLLDTLKAKCEAHIQKKVVFNTKIDKQIIGGLRLTLGTHEFDATIQTHLNNLNRLLKGAE